MTDEEIRRLGMEAGFFSDDYFEPLKAFARLVMEQDRQEAVNVICQRFNGTLFRPVIATLVQRIMDEVVQVIEGDHDAL